MRKLLAIVIMICVSSWVKAQNTSPAPTPLSASLRVDNLLYISGQVGIDRSTGKLNNASFEAETHQVMTNLVNQLKAHQLTPDDLVSTIVYLKDMNQFEAVNKVYRTYFKDRFPTRTCIAVADLPAKASVEISGIAHFKADKK